MAEHLAERTTITTSSIQQGDALAVLRSLPDESIDLLLTDPPFGYQYLSRSKTVVATRIANDTPSEAYVLLDKVLEIAQRKLKPDRHVFIFTIDAPGIYEAMAPIARKYFRQKGTLVWVKNCGSRGDLKCSFSRYHENIIHLMKGRRPMFGKRERDVLQFDRVATQKMVHATQKPVPLLKYLIEKTTQPGEVVLDPFAGSCSTVVAAQECGRIGVGIELEEALAKVAAERTGLELTRW